MRRLHISWSGMGLLLLFIFTTGQEADWNSSERQGPWMGVSSVQRTESFDGDGTARNMTKYMLTLTGRRGDGMGERGERRERGERGERGDDMGERGERRERGERGERGDGGEMGERGDEGSLQPSESFVGDLELDWIPGSTPTLQGPSTWSSPQAGLTVAGHADREVPLLPEEEPDNRRDMSGTPQSVDHVTTGYNPARMNTHTDTHTDTHTLPMVPARMNTPTDQHTHSPTHSPTDSLTQSPTDSPADQHTHSPTDSPTDQHT
ncbi:endoglucanase, partial [Oncorhynchus kisutch]|uniref:endoglucanase n=1 Tax=Oncorhynchus kisutch TaxID=8019 RepID=UPI0012DDCB47